MTTRKSSACEIWIKERKKKEIWIKEGGKEISPHVQAQQLPCCAAAAEDMPNANPHAASEEPTSSCSVYKEKRVTVLDWVMKSKKTDTQN